MFLIIGITSVVTSIFLIYYLIQIKDNKQKYIDESIAYPIYHFKFLKRYWISILMFIIFFLFSLGIATIIIAF